MGAPGRERQGEKNEGLQARRARVRASRRRREPPRELPGLEGPASHVRRLCGRPHHVLHRVEPAPEELAPEPAGELSPEHAACVGRRWLWPGLSAGRLRPARRGLRPRERLCRCGAGRLRPRLRRGQALHGQGRPRAQRKAPHPAAGQVPPPARRVRQRRPLHGPRGQGRARRARQRHDAGRFRAVRRRPALRRRASVRGCVHPLRPPVVAQHREHAASQRAPPPAAARTRLAPAARQPAPGPTARRSSRRRGGVLLGWPRP